MKTYLGIDVGAISTDIVLLNEELEVINWVYLRTEGNPISAIKEGLIKVTTGLDELEVKAVGTTGSARRLVGVIVGADVVKNEIIAHAVGVTQFYPEVKTVIEIGGQDSKLIIIRNKIVVDFAMNTVCAAGTGSFLDHQAGRLNIKIEEFGRLALKSTQKINIAGRCTVFAESDMIHKAQIGVPTEDIINGLCEAIVRNYLNNVGKGKQFLPPIVFQGGVAANEGVRRAFERELGCEVIVPKYYNVMGAIGVAILAKEHIQEKGSKFRGIKLVEENFSTSCFNCEDCPNRCEVVEVYKEEEIIDRYGDRCGKWEMEEEGR